MKNSGSVTISDNTNAGNTFREIINNSNGSITLTNSEITKLNNNGSITGTGNVVVDTLNNTDYVSMTGDI